MACMFIIVHVTLKVTFFSNFLARMLFPTFCHFLIFSRIESGRLTQRRLHQISLIAIVFGSEPKQSIIKSSRRAHCQIVYEHFNYSPFPRGGVNGEKRRAAITMRK